MVNELITTVLTGNYIPPIILGEETVNGITKQWLIDGLQQSSSLPLFLYANTKITRQNEPSYPSKRAYHTVPAEQAPHPHRLPYQAAA